MAVHEFECESCIHGYHIYKEIWNSAVGEHLICERETLNPTDRYAMAGISKLACVIVHEGTDAANGPFGSGK